MPTKYFAPLLLASLAASAGAQGRWKEIGKTSADNSVYVDPSSVKKVNGIVTARIRVKFLTPVDTRKGQWKTSHHIAMFDCAARKVAAKESFYYSDDAGTKLVERSNIVKPGFGSPIGGSMTQVALDYICKK